MKSRRIHRLNSLLKEILSEVIYKELNNPNIPSLFTVTHVDISPDLKNAKVYISIMGSEELKKTSLKALQDAAGYIAVHASKKMTIRYFPSLKFILDNSLEEQLRIESILHEISQKKSV
ncbi:MAG: 30S ribosome-binding factor RbfA [Parachlamydiales bacterium]|nr:30S ribosome-binding factor RbfA [Parachlamydiales bacterium]